MLKEISLSIIRNVLRVTISNNYNKKGFVGGKFSREGV
jgi:hypothetical protein